MQVSEDTWKDFRFNLEVTPATTIKEILDWVKAKGYYNNLDITISNLETTFNQPKPIK